MPKGKGMMGKGAISQAFQADLESTEAVEPVVAETEQQSEKTAKPAKTSTKTKQKTAPKKTATKTTVKNTVKAKKTPESAGEIERISITIDKAMLRKIDTHIFNQKQNGKSANRSRFITEAIANAVNKL